MLNFNLPFRHTFFLSNFSSYFIFYTFSFFASIFYLPPLLTGPLFLLFPLLSLSFSFLFLLLLLFSLSSPCHWSSFPLLPLGLCFFSSCSWLSLPPPLVMILCVLVVVLLFPLAHLFAVPPVHILLFVILFSLSFSRFLSSSSCSYFFLFLLLLFLYPFLLHLSSFPENIPFFFSFRHRFICLICCC